MCVRQLVASSAGTIAGKASRSQGTAAAATHNGAGRRGPTWRPAPDAFAENEGRDIELRYARSPQDVARHTLGRLQRCLIHHDKQHKASGLAGRLTRARQLGK